jgi:hypothetical protein
VDGAAEVGAGEVVREGPAVALVDAAGSPEPGAGCDAGG